LLIEILWKERAVCRIEPSFTDWKPARLCLLKAYPCGLKGEGGLRGMEPLRLSTARPVEETILAILKNVIAE
jgi:hypothetical protein